MKFICKGGHLHNQQWLADNCATCKRLAARRDAKRAARAAVRDAATRVEKLLAGPEGAEIKGMAGVISERFGAATGMQICGVVVGAGASDKMTALAHLLMKSSPVQA